MKTLRKQFAAWIIVLVGVMSFTSCDEDWWDSFSRSNFVGDWRVVEVSGYYCPYQSGDIWSFTSSGTFRGSGYELNETGTYDYHSRSRTLELYFNGQVSMAATVAVYESDYLTLNVTDYDKNATYTIRLVRTSYSSRYGN